VNYPGLWDDFTETFCGLSVTQSVTLCFRQ